MEGKKKLINLIIQQGVLPHYFHRDADTSMQILKAFYAAGARVVQYTNRGEVAINNFLQLRKFSDKELPGLKLGVGMIRNKIEATEFINEGADFIVCPGVIASVAALADNNNLLWVPGCLTTTEIILADDLGAQLVELFPGSLLGPSYLAAIKEIFPDLFFMAAGDGDSNEENLRTWFESGATVVGLGGNLISKNLMETKDYAGLESLTMQTLQIVQKIKRGS